MQPVNPHRTPHPVLRSALLSLPVAELSTNETPASFVPEPEPVCRRSLTGAGARNRLRLYAMIDNLASTLNDPATAALHEAALHGQVDDVIEQVRAGAGVNQSLPDGTTPLMTAASNGQADIIRLLRTSPDIELNASNPHGDTALHLAVKGGHLAALEALLDTRRMILNAQNSKLNSPLHIAVKKNDLGCLRALLGATGIPATWNRDQRASFAMALDIGDTETVRQRLAAAPCHGRASVNLASARGNTAIHLAAGIADADIMRALIASEPDNINQRNVQGMTALHYAASSPLPGIVDELLLAPDIELDAITDRGETAVYLATHNNVVPEALVLLLAAERDENFA